MFPNLNAEMARAGVTALILSQRVGIPYSTLTPKLSGKAPFKLSEAKDIKRALGTNKSLDYLFSESPDEEVS